MSRPVLSIPDQTMPPRILVLSGNYFDFEDPEKSEILIEDIAKALSQINRFTGHTVFPYTVAQHSVAVSHIVPPEFAFYGLMHDAEEAYTGDLSLPMKQFLKKHCPEFVMLLQRIENTVKDKFGLPRDEPIEVKYADLVVLATEDRDLMPEHVDDWGCIDGIEALDEIIQPLTSVQAYDLFMQRYLELTHTK